LSPLPSRAGFAPEQRPIVDDVDKKVFMCPIVYVSSHEPTVQVGVRVPKSLSDRLDALAERLSRPWHDASRSEALRLALERGLDAVESEMSGRNDP
jgi:hypothetical protein